MVGEYFGINEHAAKQLDNDYHMGFWDSVGFPVGFAASEGGVVIMTQHDKPVTLEEKAKIAKTLSLDLETMTGTYDYDGAKIALSYQESSYAGFA